MAEPLFNQVIQIGIVVRDAESTAHRYAELLGVADWRFAEVDTAEGKGFGFRRGDHPVETRALIAWTDIGNVELELIEPRDETSVYAEYLRENGPGLHHVMLRTVDYDRCLDRLDSKGVAILASGELQKTRFALLDTQPDLGMIIEVAAGDPLVPERRGL